MKLTKILALIGSALAGAALLPLSALAGGISLYEIGTPDVGLASAGYSARAQDASTLFKNPAGMSLLPGPQVQGGLQLLYGDLEFSKNSSTSSSLGTDNGGVAVGALPGASVFVTYPVTKKLTVGFGSFSYFGLALDYDNNWVGRYYVQEGALLGMSLVPAASFKVNEWLSIGGGLNAMYGYMHTEVGINNGIGTDGQLKLDDEEWGFGGIAGIIITPREGTRLGVTYISPVDLDFSDKPSFNNLGPVLGSRPILQNPPTLDLGVTVPQMVMVGIYQEINTNWAVMADVGWQNWHEFGKVDVGVDSDNPTSLTKNLNYDDTWHGAIGAQYTASAQWQFTGGFAYDTSAVSDANRTVTLPMGEAYRFGLGALWKYSKNLDFGAAYEFIWSGDMPVNQSSTYRGTVSGSYEDVWFCFFTLNLTWRF
jgi:long-chain fatty acid transport protein